ncbi:hypothetical protein I5535_06910 [Rhodobacteraceae bacterium F11138]|nr:hypothetical protein [Rhodobacteraceae bacterium F11138]
MTAISEIVPGHDPDGTPAAFVGDTCYTGLDQLLDAEPGLLAPDAASDLALYVNHFARDRDFVPIDDPQTYEKTYRARIESEDPAAPWQQNVMRLRDFGMPDFAEIRSAVLENGTLVFFAADALTGLPYRVCADVKRRTAPTYSPLALSPVPAPGRVRPEPRQPQAQAAIPSAATSKPSDAPQAQDETRFTPLPDDLPSLDES